VRLPPARRELDARDPLSTKVVDQALDCSLSQVDEHDTGQVEVDPRGAARRDERDEAGDRTISDPSPGGRLLRATGSAEPGEAIPARVLTNTPQVWGVAYDESTGLIYASDMNSGLWILRRTN
jgi:hypothetical protein